MRHILFGLTLAVAVAGCAPLTEAEMADREYRRGEFHAKFLEFRSACEDNGGTVVIHSRRRVGPDRMPNPGDRYTCEAP